MGERSNSLLIEKVGQNLTLGINGKIVARTEDQEFRPGSVGLFVCSFKNDLYAEARFRNLVIHEFDGID